MGLFSAINSLITAGKQKKMSKKINPVQTTYETSQPIQDLYSEGRNLYQGPMAGSGAAANNIQVNAANTNANVARNATSGSQALAVAAGVQGQADQSIQDLALKEARDKQQRFGIFSQVSQLMSQEGDKVYQDKLRKYYDDLNYKRGLEGASMQNKAAFFSGIDDTISAGAQMAMMAAGVPPVPKPNSGGSGTPMPTQQQQPGYVPTRPQYQV